MTEGPLVTQSVMDAVLEYRATQRTGKSIVTSKVDRLGVEHYDEDVVSALKWLAKQALEDSQRWFPGIAQSIDHMVLCTCGEVGEMANALKKGLRTPDRYDQAINEVIKESIDVFIYLLNIWAILGIDPAHELAIKRALNEERFGDAQS